MATKVPFYFNRRNDNGSGNDNNRFIYCNVFTPEYKENFRSSF